MSKVSTEFMRLVVKNVRRILTGKTLVMDLNGTKSEVSEFCVEAHSAGIELLNKRYDGGKWFCTAVVDNKTVIDVIITIVDDAALP